MRRAAAIRYAAALARRGARRRGSLESCASSTVAFATSTTMLRSSGSTTTEAEDLSVPNGAVVFISTTCPASYPGCRGSGSATPPGSRSRACTSTIPRDPGLSASARNIYYRMRQKRCCVAACRSSIFVPGPRASERHALGGLRRVECQAGATRSFRSCLSKPGSARLLSNFDLSTDGSTCQR